MSKKPSSLRSRVLNLLQTAQAHGPKAVRMVTLAAILGANFDCIFAAVGPEIYGCDENPDFLVVGTDEGPALLQVRFPGAEPLVTV